MERIHLVLLILLFMMSSYSCNIKNEDEKEITIYVEIENTDEVTFSDLFSHVELIPLETNEESLIREIRKLVVYEDQFYILDYKKAEILRFDANGKFLYKISDRGEGPEEYVNIGDFEIDEKGKTIMLLSAVNNSIYEYDIDGLFKNKYELPEIKGAYKCFKSLNNDTIAFFTFDYNNRIKFYSKSKGQIIKESLSEKENIMDSFSYNEFPYSNYLHRASSNILLLIENDCTISNGYIWDFGLLNNTKRQIENIEKISLSDLQANFYKLINSELINQIIILHGGNSKYFYAQIWRKGKHINIFHNKVENKNFVFSKTAENATFHPLFWHENYVIGYFSDEWGDIDDTIPNMILDRQAIKIKEELSEDDNPILIKYYFKE